MKKTISLDVALPRSIYRGLLTRAGDSGKPLNDVLLDAIQGNKPKASADNIGFQASLPRDLHHALKIRAAQQGTSMRELINQLCADGVGIQL